MADEEEQVYIGARVPKRISTILKEICQKRGEDVADFIRKNLYIQLAEMGYLTDEDKKALGIKVEKLKTEKE
ncbi:MAG: hypothetical protein PHZ02_01345 [Desulfocapsaceae bacterium]|nr:hypothetical protein [Desulfocapsaceae bacterium]